MQVVGPPVSGGEAVARSALAVCFFWVATSRKWCEAAFSRARDMGELMVQYVCSARRSWRQQRLRGGLREVYSGVRLGPGDLNISRGVRREGHPKKQHSYGQLHRRVVVPLVGLFDCADKARVRRPVCVPGIFGRDVGS